VLQQAHQGVHLLAGAKPIFSGEGIQREVANADFAAHFYDSAHRGLAAAMPFNPALAAHFRPSAVAIHNNGDVLR
jgi:hypothetical protein